MPLTVTHTNAKEAKTPNAQTFDDTVELITFGRKMGCSVEFPANETAVSAEHFGVRRQMGSGAYVYEIANGKPVFLNGKEVYDGAQVGKEDRVAVGKKNGPALRIAAVAARAGNMPVTEDIMTGGGGSLVRPVERAERSLGFFAGVLGAMAFTTVGLFFFVRTVEVKQISLKSGLEQMAKQAEASQRKMKEGLQLTTDEAFKSLATMQRKVVYQVAFRLKSGEIKDQATAFAVLDRDGKPVLATNAHVAALMELAAESNAELIAISAGGETTVKIAGVKVHPGYAVFDKFTDTFYALAGKNLTRPMRFAPGYDVALLIPENPTAIRVTAELAKPKDLEALQAGQMVMYTGFPSEDLIGTDPAKPEPTLQRGAITALTSYMMSRTGGEQNYLIQTSLPMAGGASGSPIFDVNGRVIGIANAGNINVIVNPLTGVYRMPSAALINYAQRADLVSQLIDGAMDDNWTEGLRARLTSFQSSMMKSAAEDLLYQEADWKQTEPGSAAKLIMEINAQEMNGYITLQNERRPSANFSFTVTPGRKYKLFAATPEQPLSLAVFDANDTIVSASAASSQVLATELDTGQAPAPRTLSAWIVAEDAQTEGGKPLPVLTRVAIYEYQ